MDPRPGADGLKPKTPRRSTAREERKNFSTRKENLTDNHIVLGPVHVDDKGDSFRKLSKGGNVAIRDCGRNSIMEGRKKDPAAWEKGDYRPHCRGFAQGWRRGDIGNERELKGKDERRHCRRKAQGREISFVLCWWLRGQRTNSKIRGFLCRRRSASVITGSP